MTTKQKIYNFAAGPACIPQEVLLEAQRDLLDYQGCGRSVMEVYFLLRCCMASYISSYLTEAKTTPKYMLKQKPI
jgi:hypothetical protein